LLPLLPYLQKPSYTNDLTHKQISIRTPSLRFTNHTIPQTHHHIPKSTTMHLTNALCVLILAVTVSSAALPNAQPIAAAIAEPRCGARGQPCGKTKREAEPEPEAAPKCGARGQPCGKVKRAAEAFAEALAEPISEPQEDSLYARHAAQLTRDLASIVAETQDDPEAFFASLAIRDVDELEKRDALAKCGARGQPCGKAKREAEAEADPEAEARCGARGQPCGKLRRAAEAIAEAVAFAEPEAICGARGQPCGKAKRDALALAHAADIVLSAL